MPYLGRQPSIGRFAHLDDITSSFNSACTTFSLMQSSVALVPGAASNLFISLGGVLQEPEVAYTVAGSSIIFSSAPASTQPFFGILLGDVLDVGQVSPGAVIDATSLTVTGAATLSNTLAVTGAVTGGTYNSQTINATASLTGTLAVTGAATLSNTLAVTGAVTGGTYNSQTINATASLTGTLAVTGAVTLSNTLAISGVTTNAGQLRASAYSNLLAGGNGQSIAATTWTAVLLNTENYDVGTLHSTATNTARMTIPAGGTGLYLVTGKVGWPSNATGDRLLAITKNATGSAFDIINVQVGQTIGTGIQSQDVTTIMELTAGDYIEMGVYQTSGGALVIGGDGGQYYTCKLQIVKLW